MMSTANDKVLRNRTIPAAATQAMANNEVSGNLHTSTGPLQYGPPPTFKGTPDEDVNDWLRLYERYAAAMLWSDTQKANNLVIALQDEARKWFVTLLRETPSPQDDTWDTWQKALRRDFGGEHVQDWAYIQLQDRRQQPGETPQQYVSSILHLCNRANPSMPDTEKVRCLLRGLRPEMMERVAITNPRTPGEFLQHLQRLTHVGAMARHAMLTMPTHPLPGFAADSFSPGLPLQGQTDNPAGVLYSKDSQHQPTTQPPDPNTALILGALQDSVRTLTTAIEKMGQAQQQRFPSRRSRNQGGQPVCFHCRRPGHIMRQCPHLAMEQTPRAAHVTQLTQSIPTSRQPPLDQYPNLMHPYSQQPEQGQQYRAPQPLPPTSFQGTGLHQGNGAAGV